MPKVHVQAKVDLDDVAWFNANYPGVSKQSFIKGCFRRLRELTEMGELPTGDSFVWLVARDQAKEMRG